MGLKFLYLNRNLFGLPNQPTQPTVALNHRANQREAGLYFSLTNQSGPYYQPEQFRNFMATIKPNLRSI
jgi:hypothetical protein